MSVNATLRALSSLFGLSKWNEESRPLKFAQVSLVQQVTNVCAQRQLEALILGDVSDGDFFYERFDLLRIVVPACLCEHVGVQCENII